MLKQRVITAFVLLFLILGAIYLVPPQGFAAFMGLVIGIAAWEWSRMAGITRLPLRLVYVALIAAGMLLTYGQDETQRRTLLLAGMIWWVFAFLLVRRYPRLNAYWRNPWLLSFAGSLVLLPGWSALLALRAHDYYSQLILLLFGLVAAADIGAYFSGRAFGRHKLAPAVSPNKTWEGLLGGLLSACLLACICLFLARGVIAPSLSTWLKVMAGALLVALFSVVGDLFESMIKRQQDLKDSGRILPGHGGILDRIDSITAALPLFVLALSVVPLP